MSEITPTMLWLAQPIRRKVFISYHHADEDEIQRFIKTFDHAWDSFIARGIGAGMTGDIVDSADTDYVMSRIRLEYLRDSSITLVMIGNCTWSRRYVDWELQASLRSGDTVIPNGVLAIKLPSYSGGIYPDRLSKNLWRQAGYGNDCYARVYGMPISAGQLMAYFEDAYKARNTRRHLIINPRDRMGYNRDCGHSWH
jgi:Thoeris protein ThsB, TIR-like domain